MVMRHKSGMLMALQLDEIPRPKPLGWPHCYGAIGVARGNEIDSGNGSSRTLSLATRHVISIAISRWWVK